MSRPKISSLPRASSTAAATRTTVTKVSFRRAPSTPRQRPSKPFTTTYTHHHRPTHLPSASSSDSSLASLVGELENQGAHEDDPGPKHRGGDELATRWRQIHGRDNWAGLLDPMDALLRSELIRYGELAQACYDAFDYDRASRYCGSCKYPRGAFFARLGIAAGNGYDVSRYLYAACNINLPNFFSPRKPPVGGGGANAWSERANWIGYVAVSTDEESARLGRRDVAVAWRGTVTRLEWLADLMDFLRPAAAAGIPCPDPGVMVESGFVELYTDRDPDCRFCKYSAREQVLGEVRKLVSHYTAVGEDVSISVTGHSLGSALATLSAYDIGETGVNISNNKSVPICVYSFSGPRVGNRLFKERFEGELGIKALRVVNVHDSVPRMPGVFFNEGAPKVVRRVAEGLHMPWCYSHVGVELALDHKRSPFLKDTLDPSCFHNLEAHLHLLDGYHGRGERFVLASGRDPALVNKACDFLKDHHMVPPFWRQDENKGMVRGRDGRWAQPDRHRQMGNDHNHEDDTDHHLRLLGIATASADNGEEHRDVDGPSGLTQGGEVRVH